MVGADRFGIGNAIQLVQAEQIVAAGKNLCFLQAARTLYPTLRQLIVDLQRAQLQVRSICHPQ